MSDRAAQAPLFVDALALCQWLMERFPSAAHPLERRLIALALDLFETLTLALKGRERELRLGEADETLIRLRALLRLAADSGRLPPARYEQVLERVDRIGRQLGAWQRSRGPVGG